MRRLMFVTQTHTVWGGMESWVHELGERLLARGWAVYAGLAKGARFSDPQKYARAHPHLQPVVMDARVGTESARIHAVEHALRRVKPDVVIPVGIGAAFEAIVAVRASMVVPVASMHAGWLANVLEYRDVIDVVVPIARILERLLQQELGAEKVRYVRQGVPPATTPRSPRTARLRAAIVSRLEESTKRVMDLVRVAELAGDQVELHVYGDGPDRYELEAAMTGRATFHGYMPASDLYRVAYPNLDVLLLFSPAEGGPNTIFEAMHNGVVPISSRYLGSASEGILLDGQNSRLFNIGDTAQAAQHLRSLATDREQLERLGAAARNTIASYTDDDMFAAWIDVVETATTHRNAIRKPLSRPSGRLERLGLPVHAADLIRNIVGVRYPHRSGWEEWPGSQPTNAETVRRIERELEQLDSESRR